MPRRLRKMQRMSPVPEDPRNRRIHNRRISRTPALAPPLAPAVKKLFEARETLRQSQEANQRHRLRDTLQRAEEHTTRQKEKPLRLKRTERMEKLRRKQKVSEELEKREAKASRTITTSTGYNAYY